MTQLAAFTVLTLLASQAGLRIVVIEGEGAVNIIQQKTAVAPIVEVRDRNNLPVGGATVTFTIQGGNTAVFAGGSQTMTVTTNAAGRAVAAGVNPLSSGTVQIQTTAALQGQTAIATITQTNVMTAALAGAATAAVAGGGGLGIGAIAGIAGGVVAGGAALALSQVEKGEEAQAPAQSENPPSVSSPPPTAPTVDPAVRAAIGTYTLQTVNGAGLPATTVASPPASCPVVTENATLRLGETPQDFEITESSRTVCAQGSSTTFFSISNGTWTLSNGTITFTARNDNWVLDNATLSGSTLTMTVIPPHIDSGRVAPRVNTVWRK